MDFEEQTKRVTEHLGQFISDHKKDFMERVLENRTRYVTIVLEDIYQSHNASAVIRTCECMGLQDIHVIETRSEYQVNKQVLQGSNKWLDIIRYRKKNTNNAAECFKELRARGYRIAVTDPRAEISVNDLPIDKPVAIVMGNEKHGISSYAFEQGDLKMSIPMVGFTESLNISVSAAICMNTVMTRLRQSAFHWRLTEEEKMKLRLHWYRKAVRRSELVEDKFLHSIR